MKKMRIAIAPDSFKGSLTALEAANCIEKGFRKVFRDAGFEKIPMADGGEGTVSAMTAATGGGILKRREPFACHIVPVLNKPIEVLEEPPEHWACGKQQNKEAGLTQHHAPARPASSQTIDNQYVPEP